MKVKSFRTAAAEGYPSIIFLITAQATELGLDTCILGWFDNEKIMKICSVSGDVRLVISLGYKKENDALRQKKRKSIDELIKFI